MDTQNYNHSREVVLIIPIYCEKLSQNEEICLRHNLDILKDHSIYFIAPEGLDLNYYQQFSIMKIEYFEKQYFQGIAGYNKLMLSIFFYERFKLYKYMLICQLDVFVFSDQLVKWCSKNYDYVGAPWINKPLKIALYVLVKTGLANAIKLLLTRNIFNAVGNGGFSLRKIETFISSLKSTNESSLSWNANEDYYWSFFAVNNGKPFFTPNSIEALDFCIELDPRKNINRIKNRLPFAIHAWERYDIEFWKPYLIGYNFKWI